MTELPNDGMIQVATLTAFDRGTIRQRSDAPYQVHGEHAACLRGVKLGGAVAESGADTGSWFDQWSCH